MLLYDYIADTEKVRKVSSQLSQIQLQDRPCLKVLAKRLNNSDSRISLVKSLLNFPLFSENDENYENATGYYINMIKILIRELSTQILNQLFDPKTGDFPILRSLLIYSHHKDDLIKVSARLGLLSIFKKSKQGKVLEYVNKFAIPYQLSIIISFLNSTILNLKNSIENGQMQLGNNLCKIYESELEYIDDILCLKEKSIAESAKLIFLNDFIIQLLFPAITERHALIKNTTEINLFLLGKLMKSITNEELNEDIIKFLLPFDLKETSLNASNDYNTTSAKTIEQVRKTVIIYLESNVLCTETNLSSLYIIGILKMVIGWLNTLKYIHGILVFYQTYAKLLLDYFLHENVRYTELERIKLNIIFSIVVEIAKSIARSTDTPLFLIKSQLSLNLKELYLNMCQKITYINVVEFSSEVDGNYRKYIENREIDIFINCSFLNKMIELDKIRYSETECNLLKLFHLRFLCLQMSNKTEKVLPLLPEKTRIGQTLSVKNCIFCKVVAHKTPQEPSTCTLDHVVRLTSSEFLVLEYVENQLGIVIFSCYYKDLMWSECKNNRLLLWEVGNSTNHKLKSPTNIQTILLEFKTIDDHKIIVKILPKARSKQCEVIQEKLDDLLEKKIYKKAQNRENT